MCLLGGGLGGYVLDQWLGSSPFLTLVGIIAGISVSILGVHRMLKDVNDEVREYVGVWECMRYLNDDGDHLNIVCRRYIGNP